MKFDRIAVVGISASGKSTFARALASRTGLPLLHGDQLEWLPDWVVRPKAELDKLHRAWLEKPRWIIEGWIDTDRIDRLNAADVVIDLDYSRWLCAWRLLARMLHGAQREEMPQGCVDAYSLRFLGVVFRKLERPAIEGALAAATMRSYVRLETPREALAWLQQL
jgi:adenylate kinase family enzyme